MKTMLDQILPIAKVCLLIVQNRLSLGSHCCSVPHGLDLSLIGFIHNYFDCTNAVPPIDRAGGR